MSEEKKVEQDERGTFEAWAKGKFNLKPLSGEGAFFYDKENTQAAWSAWQARAASTSANVAQGAEAVTNRYHNDTPEHRAARQDVGVDKQKTPPFVMCLHDAVEMWNSTTADSFEDELMEFAVKAINFYKDTLPGSAATPAQTAITDDARDAARYRWLRDGEEDVFCVFGSNGTWGECGHIEIYGDRLDEHIDAALTAAKSGEPK